MKTVKILSPPHTLTNGTRRRRRMLCLSLMAMVFSIACLCEGCSTWLSTTSEKHRAEIWAEGGMTGTFTSTQAGGQGLVGSLMLNGETVPVTWPAVMGEIPVLEEQGYLAVRIPHAPPTYTASTILSPTVYVSYYSPPETTTVTTVPITVTHRDEYLDKVNARFPISDDHSHWEVWWLPEGETFPIPEEPFRVQAGDWPNTVQTHLFLDFGEGVDASNCAGCPLEGVLYNGYTFIGPFDTVLTFGDEGFGLPGNPRAAFGAHCGHPSAAQMITPTVPFTHVHWLENYDTAERVFTITADSSQGWSYTYYYTAPAQSELLLATGLPFTVTAGPQSGYIHPGCVGIMAVHTPTISSDDKMRETFTLTATSTLSPEVRAYTHSFAFAPAYTLNEHGDDYHFYIYLPLVLRLYAP